MKLERIDSHSHFEPRLLDADQMISEMDKNGVAKAVLVSHLTNPPESVKPGLLMAIQRWMFYHDLLRPLAIKITQIMYKKDGEWNLKGLQYFMKSTYKQRKLGIVRKPDNAAVAEVLNRHPDRFLGWVFVNPAPTGHSVGAIQEVEKWIDIPGMIGIKLHPFWHRFPMRQVQEVAAYAEARGLPVNIHLGFDEAGDFRWLVQQFPRLKIIFAHLGVPYYKRLWSIVKGSDFLYMDISSTYHVDRKLVERAVQAVGAFKILYATDTPYTKPGSMKALASWIETLPVTDNEKRAIFSENFKRLISREK